MKLSNSQKEALEKITGKSWDSWHPDAVKAYFAFTDRGDDKLIKELLGENWRDSPMPIWRGDANEVQTVLFELITYHKSHAYTVECWKEDFLPDYERGIPPLLFLWDFFLPQPDYEKWIEQGCPKEMPTFMYPDAFIKHAFEIYKEVRGIFPIDDISGCKEWAEKLGVI